MGSRRRCVQRHDQRPGDRAARHQRRDDPQGVRSREGDRSLRDERGPQQPGGVARLPLRLGEDPGADCGGERQRQRRGHPGRHDRRHDLLVAGGEARQAEGVGHLVDRAAHVEGHHQAEQRPEGNGVRTVEAVEPVRQAPGRRGDRLADGRDHEETDDEGRDERDHDDRHDAGHGLRHLDPQDRQHDAAGEQAADEAAQEAGADGVGKEACDDAGHEAGPVGHRISDEAGEDRHEHRERDATDLEHHAGHPGLREQLRDVRDARVGDPVERAAVDLGGDLRTADHEGQGDQDATSRDERDHVADAGHEPLAHPGGPGRPVVGPDGSGAGAGRRRRRSWRRLRCRGRREEGRGLVEDRIRVVDRPLDGNDDRRLAGEALPVAHLDVRRQDDDVGGGDLLVAERGRPRRALGLHGDAVPGLLGCLLEGLGSHVRVRDARRA